MEHTIMTALVIGGGVFIAAAIAGYIYLSLQITKFNGKTSGYNDRLKTDMPLQLKRRGRPRKIL